MAHEHAVEFYKIIRTSPEIWQDLNAAPDTETLIAKITTLSAAHGLSLSPEQIRAALADLPTVIADASGEELSDDELELVAAGAQVNCAEEEVKGFG